MDFDKDSGWFSIHRRIQDHWLWNERPFSKGQAWIDLILMADHKVKYVSLGGDKVRLQKGSVIASELFFEKRWGWSRSKIRRFLEMLENDSMVTKKSDNRKTVICIVNYSKYQDAGTTKKQPKNIQRSSGDHQRDTNNNLITNNKQIKTVGCADNLPAALKGKIPDGMTYEEFLAKAEALGR